MGYFSSIRHEDKTPERAAHIMSVLKKGIPKPKSYTDSSKGHYVTKTLKNGKYEGTKHDSGCPGCTAKGRALKKKTN